MTEEVLGGNYEKAFLAFSLEGIKIMHSSGYMKMLPTGLMGRGDNQECPFCFMSVL